MRLLIVFVLILISSCTTKTQEIETIVLNEKNTVVFNTPVTSDSVAKVQLKLLELQKNNPKEVFLFLNTPGGSVLDGMQLVDFIKGLGFPVHTITMFAASMGHIFVQSLDTRYILENGVLMQHRMSGGVEGQIPGEANSRLEFWTNYAMDIQKMCADRVGVSLSDFGNLIRDEFWATGKDAVEKNHADRLVRVRCDETLDGTYSTDITTLFGKVTVEFSKCPLIGSPISVKRASGEEADKETVEKYITGKRPIR